jgi:subfamily B ATP-binding cassette protein MsbA
MKLVKRIVRFIVPYWKYILAAIVASLVFALLNSFTIWMSATFIETIFSQQAQEQLAVEESESITQDIQTQLSLKEFLKEKTRLLVERESKIETLRIVCIVVFIAFLLKNCFGYFKGILIARVNYKTVNNIRNTLYEHLQKLSLGYFDKRKAGEITSIAINDVSVLSSSLTGSLEKLIMTPIQIIILITLLFIISWKLTLLVFLLVPAMGVILIEIGKSIRRKSKRTYKQTAVFISILQETILALRIVKAFAMEREEIKKFKNATEKYFTLSLRQRSLQLLASPVNEILGVVAAVFLLWFGGTQVLKGSGLSPEDFMRFFIFLFMAFQPIKDMTGVNNQIQAGLAAAERLFRIIDTQPKIQDHPNAVEVAEFEKSIELRHVWFQYEDNPYVLKDIDVRINRGEIAAFVGQSGAGKSTLVDLIPRFYEVTQGGIFIDDMDIREIKNNSLKKLFGIVSQETILFNDTVKYNIAYGSSVSDDEAIYRAAKVANAHDFILQLEKGYDTIVGDRGVKLSGGQCQRVAIARAILRNPPILILDEATSALDTESERLVQEAIDRLMKNRTVLAIAHRLSTVIHADKIVVLDKGKVVDVGKHRKLLKTCVLYKRLYQMQFQDRIDENE